MEAERKGTETKKRGKRAALAALALLTATSVTVGGLFSSPAALLQDDAPQTGVVFQLDDGADDDDADGSGQDETGTEKTRRRAGVRAQARRRILELPLYVRLFVVLPLWAIGRGVTAAAGALWTAVLSPLAGKLAGALVMFAVLLGVFCLAAKAIFPDLPLRKLVSRRGLLTLAVGAAALGLADAVLPLIWLEYERVRAIVLGGGMLLALGAAAVPFALREQKRRAEAAVPAQKADKPEALEFTDAGGTFTVRVPRKA